MFRQCRLLCCDLQHCSASWVCILLKKTSLISKFFTLGRHNQRRSLLPRVLHSFHKLFVQTGMLLLGEQEKAGARLTLWDVSHLSAEASFRSALQGRVAAGTCLLQEQMESCCFHGYCLKLGRSGRWGGNTREGEKQKRERARRALRPILLEGLLQSWKTSQVCWDKVILALMYPIWDVVFTLAEFNLG